MSKQISDFVEMAQSHSRLMSAAESHTGEYFDSIGQLVAPGAMIFSNQLTAIFDYRLGDKTPANQNHAVQR